MTWTWASRARDSIQYTYMISIATTAKWNDSHLTSTEIQIFLKLKTYLEVNLHKTYSADGVFEVRKKLLCTHENYGKSRGKNSLAGLNSKDFTGGRLGGSVV